MKHQETTEMKKQNDTIDNQRRLLIKAGAAAAGCCAMPVEFAHAE